MTTRMRIGALAARAQVTPRTVRYYESLGLIPPGDRQGSGQHYYPEHTVARLHKIEQLKQLGLSLDEIGDVIELYFTDPSGQRPKRKVLAILRQHLADVDDKLTALAKLRGDLRAHITRFERWLAARAGSPSSAAPPRGSRPRAPSRSRGSSPAARRRRRSTTTAE
jgi:DNA-binding transcriptional MerR regulator